MGMVFIMFLGFLFQSPSTDCTEILHELRTAHKLQIVSTATVEDTVVYTLTERYGHKKKTAQIGCRIGNL